MKLARIRPRHPVTPRRQVARCLMVICGLTAQLSQAAKAQRPDTLIADSLPLYRLDGISVSVARTEDQVNRLPYAVGLLGAAELHGLRPALSLGEALPEIPGVFVANRYNPAVGDAITIRGFGARSQFGVRGVRIIQDGIPLTLPDGQSQLNNLDLAAAGRVEVIRGPASALYGNASGGVISVQSQEAPESALRPEIWALAGGFGNDRAYQRYDLKASGRGSRFHYFGHLGHFDSDGYRLHSAARTTLTNLRLGFDLGTDSDLTAILNYADTPTAESPSSLPDSLARAKPDTARDIALSPEQCPPEPSFTGCQDLGEESRQGQAGLRFRHRFAGAHRLSLMGYALYRNLENRIPFTLINLDRWGGGARLEYRYRPTDRRLSGLTAGIDLDHQSDDRRENARDADGVGPVTLDQDERVTSFGLFLQAGVIVTPALEFTISTRYDRARFAVTDRLVDVGNPDDSGVRNLDQLSPLAGLRYTVRPWLNFYANVGRSFQTPTTTELTDSLGGFNQELQPERAVNYEIGVKGTAAARVSYSLALFRADIDDLIVGSEVPGIERVFFENAGSSVHQGVELGLTALPRQGLILSAAYTYSDLRFERFRSAQADFDGNQLPGVPPHRLFARLGYARPGRPAASLELNAVDGYFVDNANQNRNAGYAVVDLRLSYTFRSARLAITPILGLQNLLDQRYNSSVVVNAVGGRYYEPAPGRNLYIGLRAGAT